MLIKSITTTSKDQWGRILSRTSTMGKFKDKSICIDTFKDHNGVTTSKQYVIWDDFMQKIVNKYRKSSSKRFERIG